MAVLLDGLMSGQFTDDPQQNQAIQRGILNFGLQLMQTRGRRLGPGLGQAGVAGIQGFNDLKQEQFRDQLRKQQGEEYTRRKMLNAREDTLANLPSQFIKPDQQGNNPSAFTPGMSDLPGLSKAYMSAPGGLQTGLALQSALQKQEPTLHEFKQGSTYGTFEGGRVRPLLSVPSAEKPDTVPSAIKEYNFAREQGYKGSFEQWDRERRKAGASQVSVSTGEKGFKNELALKGDFKSEPIYKDYQDMQSAYKQIKAGIAQGTPIGDVATATKIMKLLDPGSVVRESELGIAMAAGGRMDRLQNFVQMQLKGEKLTPTMRQEFGKLADELYEAAGQAYNVKRSEYEGIGKRYGLDTTNLGAPHKSSRSSSVRDQADAILRGE